MMLALRLSSWQGLGSLALVVMLAGLSVWLERVSEPKVQMQDAAFDHAPDVLVNGVRVALVGGDARMQQVLLAERMAHHPDDDTYTLDAPQLWRQADGQSALYVESRRGLASGNGENLYFLDAVRVERGDLTMKTDYLRVMVSAARAHTDKAVVIQQGRMRIDAIGMTIDNARRTVDFGSGGNRVRSVYEK
jgi:lipopolysaccharide export system protein LptC